MAIEKMMLDSIAGGYRFYLDDLKQRRIEGEYYDEVERLFNRILELGEECYDMNVFYAKMQEENITVRMADVYTRALTEEGNKKYGTNSGTVSSDDQMFQANLNALRASIKALRDNFDKILETSTPSQRMRMLVDNDPQMLIKAIEEMIALAEQPGMTYPRFLRLQIEQGLDKVSEGAVTRRFLENTVATHKALMSPELVINMWEEKLARYNEVASKNKFNIVDLHEWELISDSIERDYKPRLIRNECVYDHFMRIFDLIERWEISYCPYTPYEILPWSSMPMLQAMADLDRIQKTAPGILKEYEKQFFKYFGLRLKDIVENEDFLHKIKTNYIDQSQELVEHLLLEVYPHCRPFNDLPKAVVDMRVEIHRCRREVNPMRNEPYLRLKRHYASVYGEGYMEQCLKDLDLLDADKVGIDTNAAPWDLDSFLHNTQGKIVVSKI